MECRRENGKDTSGLAVRTDQGDLWGFMGIYKRGASVSGISIMGMCGEYTSVYFLVYLNVDSWYGDLKASDLV